MKSEANRQGTPKAFFELPQMPARWTSLVAALFAEAAVGSAEPVLYDTSGAKLTAKDVIARAAALARVLSCRINPDSKYVGIIMPPCVAGAIVNVAVAMMGKVAVNLNYGSNTRLVNHALTKCGITDIVAAPLLLSKTKIEPAGTLHDPEVLAAAVDAEVMGWVHGALTGAREDLPKHFPGLLAKPTDTATILFTTGSTGLPKGTELDHRSILSNMLSIREQFAFEDEEKLLGCAPFFHALGFTGTIWTPLILRKKVFYHANSLDPKRIVELVESEKITIVLTTPSLMRMYLVRATKENFASVRHLVLGAEKVKAELRTAVTEKLGIEVEECYGATEFGPLITANVNRMVTLPSGKQVWGNRPGSAGLPVPGVSIEIRDIESGQVLPAGAKGLICATGPQRMVGYLNDPERTAKAVVDGWYLTGDVGYLDEDGFLWIKDRLSRFAKIAGEMVPLEELEAVIFSITKTDELSVHITNIPDAKRGERLVVFFTVIPCTPAELCDRLSESVPAIWVPSPKDFIQIAQLPMGSTNKLDMQALKEKAIAERGE